MMLSVYLCRRMGATTRLSSLAVSFVLVGCVATVPQNQGSLAGLSLVANGAELSFAWPADSLVVRELRPGVAVDLVAQYTTAAGPVTGETISSARVGSTAQPLRFTLPVSLRNVPLGPVCLRLRANGRTALPIRTAMPGVASDSFQHIQWGRQVAASSRRVLIEGELIRLSDGAAFKADAEAALRFSQWKTTQRLIANSACQNLSTANSSPTRPPSVLEGSTHSRAARRECVWRYQQLAGDLSDKVMSGIGTSGKGAQSSVMVSAYREHATAMESGFVPLLLSRPLQVTSLVDEEMATQAGLPVAVAKRTPTSNLLAEEVKKQGKISPASAAGIVDSFSSCLRDSEAQFKLSLETWQREQDPRLQKGRDEALRGECRARFSDDERRVQRIAERQTRIRQLQQELQTIPPLANEPLPNGRSLINEVCT